MRSVLHARIFSVCAGMFFISACAGPPASPPRFTFPFLKEPGFQGRAEIAIYDASVVRYGQPRSAELVLITVAEPMDAKQRVKSDKPGPDIVYALKQNQALNFQTGVYPYHYLNSLFWQIDNGRLLKAAMTLQEWCGTTTKVLLPQGGLDRLMYHSYWDNEADGEMVLVRPDVQHPDRAILYDELPLIVRTPEAEHYRKLQVFPLLMSSQVTKPDWDIYGEKRSPAYEPGTLEPESVDFMAMGVLRKARKITVRSGPGLKLVDEYFVEQNPARTLLGWNRHDGAHFVLRKISYAEYWKLNKPGDTLP